jgi:hypothetical protein
VRIVIFIHAAVVRFWNYALYDAAIAAGVLLAADLPAHPTPRPSESACFGR